MSRDPRSCSRCEPPPVMSNEAGQEHRQANCGAAGQRPRHEAAAPHADRPEDDEVGDEELGEPADEELGDDDQAEPDIDGDEAWEYDDEWDDFDERDWPAERSHEDY